MGYKKKCANCGKEFETNNNSVINCSIKCKSEFSFSKFINNIENKNNIFNLKEWLYNKYIIEKQTYRWIISTLKINNRTVSKLLKYYNIPIRTGSDAIKSQWSTPEKRNARRTPNKYILKDKHAEILIYRKNKIVSVLIDIEDIDKCKKYHWTINSGYVSAYYKKENKNSIIKLHRYLLNVNTKDIIDHANGNTLDNRKNNLRKCTYLENAWNRKIYNFNETGCKGVNKRKSGSYQATITFKGQNNYLGTYNKLSDAIKARKDAELKYFGEFSIYNREKSY